MSAGPTAPPSAPADAVDVRNPAAPPAGFVSDCRAFFERRLSGPHEARGAVLEALAGGEPYPMGWRLVRAGGQGVSAATLFRAALFSEVAAAAFRACVAAHAGPRSDARLERARGVLAADALITFAWELAADLGGEEGARARKRLAAALGANGFLGALGAEGRPDAAAAAAAFANELNEIIGAA